MSSSPSSCLTCSFLMSSKTSRSVAFTCSSIGLHLRDVLMDQEPRARRALLEHHAFFDLNAQLRRQGSLAHRAHLALDDADAHALSFGGDGVVTLHDARRQLLEQCLARLVHL